MKALKTLTALFLILASLLSFASCAPEYTVENFTVLNYDLESVELEEFIGEPIVLNFWATWCYYCKVEMPDFNEAYHDYPTVRFMMINHTDGKNETVDKAKAYVESEGFDFPVYFDTTLDAAEKYGIEAFPMTFFINRDGDLAASHRGAMSAQKLRGYLDMIA